MSQTFKMDNQTTLKSLKELNTACHMRYGLADWLDSIIQSQSVHLDYLKQCHETDSLEPGVLAEYLDLLGTGMAWAIVQVIH